MTEIKNEVKKYISENGNTHILIHSDVLFGFKVKFENQLQFLEQHCNELEEICEPLDILMPSFNYDFCKGKPYDITNDVSQVGNLSEYFRSKKALWRTVTPVFNFSGTGVKILQDDFEKTDPFDKNSVFSYLNKNKGLLMHYGSGFHTTTLIHFAERISGKLIYRYDKVFDGQIIYSDNKTANVELIYHVRPLVLPLEYDWIKIENDLLCEQLISKYKEGRTQITLMKIEEVVGFWLEKIKNDPLYFLMPETRCWVEKKYNELGRPFIINDFE